jgi:nucleotide-binding universal stress UspA family protein
VPFTVLLCTDGSDLAHAALARGLGVVATGERVVVATAVGLTHPMDVVGTGMAAGVMSPQDAIRADEESVRVARQVVEEARRRLDLADAETAVVSGQAGPALCDLAASLPADVVVIGTRGQGGWRRAVLGSVSDHVVRNSPCPVVVCSVDEV